MAMDQPSVEYDTKGGKNGKRSMMATKREVDELDELTAAWKKERGGKSYAGGKFSLEEFMSGKVE